MKYGVITLILIKTIWKNVDQILKCTSNDKPFERSPLFIKLSDLNVHLSNIKYDKLN
jgi:hypothetical protein